MADLGGHTSGKRLSLGPPSLDPALLHTCSHSQTSSSPLFNSLPQDRLKDGDKEHCIVGGRKMFSILENSIAVFKYLKCLMGGR